MMRIAPAGLLTGLLIFSACSPRYVPSEIPIDPSRIPGLRVAGPVKIVNAQTSSEDTVTPLGPNSLSVNYKEYTERAIKFLKTELERRGAVVSDSASKVIRFSITDVKMYRVFTCIINYTVETGDGYVRGFEGSSESWNFKTAADGALANVVMGVLQNDKILSYLGASQ